MGNVEEKDRMSLEEEVVVKDINEVVDNTEKKANGLKYYQAVDALKFWLMPFVCFISFGFPFRYGYLVSTLSGFAPLCFFILSGFFALIDGDENSKRLERRIKRTGLMFLILFALCLSVNIIFYLISGADILAVLSALTRKRVLFNFFVLCAWPFPMGESIWFIQSLFYSYIILHILYRLHLEALRWILLALCAVLMIFSGELAGVVGFNFLGAPYLPPNVFTRALPYVLIGGLMRKYMDVLKARKAWNYLLMIPVGLLLAYCEFTLLSRTGLLVTTSHAIGLGLTAFGLCAWVIFYLDMSQSLLCAIGRPVARRIYLISQLIAFILLMLSFRISPNAVTFVRSFSGLLIYLVCLALVLPMTLLTMEWNSRF